jgi:mannitol-1-phosphate 5-dehydrogenase
MRDGLIIMPKHIFTGFGFGPIQAGLFAKEAFESGNFSRIVAAEIDQSIVDAVRANKGSYYVNIAKADGIEVQKIDGVELLNPSVPKDRQALVEVLAQSTEITTCLPSVNFYDSGGADSVAALIADGLRNSKAKATIIYTAENHNRAAEILEESVSKKIGGISRDRVQFLNTVIGKMSRVVDDPAEIAQLKLKTISPDIRRAFLVEEFNRILVTRTKIKGFKPGIEVFIEKDNLLPFEEAKLYGHNAVHSLLGFLGTVKGYTKMTELKEDRAIMQIGRDAFLQESGAALIKKYAYLGDELFIEAGYENYAEDLLERMTNPYLADTVARVCRDVVRKLGINERIFGTMQLVLEYGIEPKNMALGAMAGIAVLLEKAQEYNLQSDLRFGDWRKLNSSNIEKILNWLWKGQTYTVARPSLRLPRLRSGQVRSGQAWPCLHGLEARATLIKYVQDAQEHLEILIER